MQIAVFGGAFDPPHIGHEHIAKQLLAQKSADQVWFLPVKYHAFGKKMTSDEHRLAMLSLIVQDNMKIETFELEQTNTNFTFKTLTALSLLYPDHTFSFVIGSDNLQHFSEWDNAQELVAKYTVYVYPRAGFPMEPLLANMQPLTNVEEVHVSSTMVREKLMAGESIAGLVPQAVQEYIQTHQVY